MCNLPLPQDFCFVLPTTCLVTPSNHCDHPQLGYPSISKSPFWGAAALPPPPMAAEFASFFFARPRMEPPN